MRLITAATRTTKLLRGLWTFTAHAPVVVNDPGKFHNTIKGIPRIVLPRGAPADAPLILPVSYVRELLDLADARARKILEGLFEGGGLKWAHAWENLVVDVGLDHILDVELSSATQITTWYLLLTDGTPTIAAGDTMASHAGWVEVQNYDEAVRQTWSEAGVSAQSITNSASPATFTIDTDSTTVGGAALTSVNTKGGTTGTLYAVGAFTAGDKSLDDNDTLDVTATFTSADDGV